MKNWRGWPIFYDSVGLAPFRKTYPADRGGRPYRQHLYLHCDLEKNRRYRFDGCARPQQQVCRAGRDVEKHCRANHRFLLARSQNGQAAEKPAAFAVRCRQRGKRRAGRLAGRPVRQSDRFYRSAARRDVGFDSERKNVVRFGNRIVVQPGRTRPFQ